MNSNSVRTFGYLAFFLILIIAFFVLLRLMNQNEHGYKFERETRTTPDISYIEIKGLGRFPYQRLFEAISKDGETMDEFIVRIGPELRKFSNDHHYEACGVIATDSERFGIIVGTNNAHTSCVNFHDMLPKNMKSTGMTVHSHIAHGTYKANRTDLIGLRGTAAGSRAYVGQNWSSGNPDRFSDTDMTAPGYLVGLEAVWLQRGPGTEPRKIAPII